MTYQEEIKKHLCRYKLEHLGITKPGIFVYRGRNVICDHILPLEQAHRNLLEEAQAAASAFLATHPKQRHRYFHHLNSSQAFAFNLFFPYFDGGPDAASALLRALGQDGVLIEWRPEAVPDHKEGTNIDILWRTDDGAQTFCEVKLSEAEFGKAPDDARHRDKLDKYVALLAGHLEPNRLEKLAFFEAYQFNRNVWHMVRADNNRMVFLLPRANAILRTLLENLVAGVVPSTRKRISIIFIEDVIAKLSVDRRSPAKLLNHAIRLEQKYSIQGDLPSEPNLEIPNLP